MDDHLASVEHLTDEVTLVAPTAAVQHSRDGRQLRVLIADLARQGRVRIVLDLADMGELWSFDLAALMHGLQLCRTGGGAIALVCGMRQHREALAKAGLDAVFVLSDTVPQAVESLARVQPPEVAP
ncbi:hypothetical protein L1856_10000 [Streptomyces sp. Tue 6430]|nr:hypothetical protein [Streptomyces sp. Tue 6430]